MVAHGVGPGPYGMRGRDGLGVVVHPHMTEAQAEPRFKEGAALGVKRSARPAQHLMYDRRRGRTAEDGGSERLAAEFLLLAGAFTADLARGFGHLGLCFLLLA